jgi:hypothetical protein
MKIQCYLFPGWEPRIRPASRRRDWMDATPESFAYRCLPLATANAHGWEIGNAGGFSARWMGGSDVSNVEIVLDEGADPVTAPVSLFGQGTITFHIAGLFRTPPGWNLWLGGAPNHAKDGIAPLSGLIETDWSPYSFTMNWRFTRPDHWVRFEPDEPIAFFFPVERGVVDAVEPELHGIDEAPELKRQFEAWSRSRDAFHARMRDAPPEKPADRWQKLYYRGVDPDGRPGAADHQAKIQPRPFVAGEVRCPVSATPAPDATLAKRDWLIGVQRDLRRLSPRLDRIDRVIGIGAEDFLDRYYAANWPVILSGELADWPALSLWTPEYLTEQVGGAIIEYQGGRSSNDRFELEKDRHRRTAPFDDFIWMIRERGNDAYLTAYNSGATAEALRPLRADLGRIDKLLAHGPEADEGMLWIGPAGTFTPLHHDLTNNLLVQIAGRKRIVMAPPSETPKLANAVHVFSEAGDLLSDEARARFPALADVRKAELVLEPGEILFLPIGWWHQVEALDFSISATYTNFRWRNDWHEGFPG